MDRRGPSRCRCRARLGFCHLTVFACLVWLAKETAAQTLSTTSRAASSSSVAGTSPSPDVTARPTTTIDSSASQNVSSTSRTASTSSRLLLPLPPGQSPPSAPSESERRDGSLVNIYFLLVGVGVVVVVAGYWFYHRRRAMKSARVQDTGRSALARDVEGWVSQRRWMHAGRMVPGTRASPTSEEGLDERGEAPPPYEHPPPAGPRSAGGGGGVGTGNQPAQSNQRRSTSSDTAPIPLHDLPSRSPPAFTASGESPPKYETLPEQRSS